MQEARPMGPRGTPVSGPEGRNSPLTLVRNRTIIPPRSETVPEKEYPAMEKEEIHALNRRLILGYLALILLHGSAG